MTMTLMSEKRQLEIVEACKVAADLVADGTAPTAAVVKAAKEAKANEHELQRMVEAYNTSATLAHLRDAQEKAASFPLADYDAAKAELFPVGPHAKVARTIQKTAASAVPDLRTAKVAGGFWPDMGQIYDVRSGEHKGSQGKLVKCTTEDTDENLLEGKTTVSKRTTVAVCTLLISGEKVVFSDPSSELCRDYGNTSHCAEPSPTKESSTKVADHEFYGCVGDAVKVVAGEKAGSKGVVKRLKKIRKETKEIDGGTETTSKTVDQEIVVSIGDGTWTCTDPTQIEKDYDVSPEIIGYSEKSSGAWDRDPSDRGPSDRLSWVRQHESVFHAPQDTAGNTAHQNSKKARAWDTDIPRDEISHRDYVLRQCEHWKKEARGHLSVHQEHKGMALTAMHKIAEIFRGVTRPDWTTFEGEVLAVHDKEASVFLDAIWDAGRLGSVKCQRAPGAVKVAYVNDATEIHKLFTIFKFASEVAGSAKAQEREALENYENDRADALGYKKTAAMGLMMNSPMLMAAQLSGQYDAALPQATPSRASLNPNVGMESELNKARLQAAVREMMNDDEVISQHASQDPARVVKIVEQLSQVHPKILDMPSVLQSGVRKALELGSIEPFELKQLQSLGEPSAPAPQAQ